MIREGMLTVSQVAEMCPSARGGHVTPLTVRNWMTNGVRGVKLESFRLGGVRLTTRENLEKFIEALNRSGGG